MKSTMKSTFAIIAVALMIMVAVVPMVGFFTDSSEAKVPVSPKADPSDPEGDPDIGAGIIIKVNVYDASGAPVTQNILVKLTYGESSEYTVLSGAYANSCYTITVKDTLVTKGKLTVVDTTESHKAVAGYDVKTIDAKLEKGAVKTYDILGLNKSSGDISVKLTDSSTLSTLFALTNVDVGLAVKYKLYSDAEGTTEITKTSGIATLSNNKFKVDYQGTYEKVFVEITDVVVTVNKVDTVHDLFSSKIVQVVGTGVNNPVVTLDQVAKTFTVVANDIPSAKLTINKIYKLEETTKSGEVSTVKLAYADSIVSNGASIAYYYTPAYTTGEQPTIIAPTNMDVTVKYSDSVSDSITGMPIDANYTPSGFYGSVAMGAIGAYDGQSVKLKIKAIFQKDTDPTQTTEKSSEANAFVKGGLYVALYKLPVVSGYTFVTVKVQVTVQSFTIASYGDIPKAQFDENGYANVETVGQKNIVIDNAGYTLVTMTIDMENGDNIGVKLSTEISGISSAFGYEVKSGGKATVVNDTNGQFKLYIKQFDEISFAPAQGEKFTFTTSDKKILNADTYTSTLTIAAKKMNFLFTDGDANVLTEVTINFKAVTPAVIYGNNGVTQTDATTGFEYVTIYSSYIDLPTIQFYPTKATFNFANNAKNYATYKEGILGAMYMVSLDTTYTLNLLSNSGSLVSSGENALFQYGVYNVYKNEGGSLIFDATPVQALANVTFTQGSVNMTFKTRSDYVDVTIGSSIVPVAVLVPTATATADYLLEEYYLVSVEGNMMVIVAAADSLTGTVVKTDKETPIAGVTVKLNKGNDVKYTTVTDADGSFTVLSDVAITDAFNFTFSNNLDEFAPQGGYPAVKNNEKVDTFAATADYFVFLLTDEDGAIVTLTPGYKLGGFGDDITVSEFGMLGAARALTAGQIVNPTYKNGNDTVRTFDQYVVTAIDIKLGIIDLTTNESTYSIIVQDSEGTKIDSPALPVVIYRENGVKVGDPIGGVVRDSTGKYHVLLSDLGTKTGEYAVEVTNAGDYKFLAVTDLTAVAFEDGVAVIESLYTTIYFAVTDAAGEKLPLSEIVAPAAVANYKVTDGIIDEPIAMKGVTEASDLFYFIGDEDATYKPSAAWGFIAIPNTDPQKYVYNVAKTTAIKAGAIAAKEQEVTFTVTDADGVALKDLTGITINAFDALGVDKGKVVDDVALVDGEVTAIFEVKDYIYAITDSALLLDYSFDPSVSYAFVANEGTYYANFMTANGYDIDNIDEFDIEAFDENGKLIYFGDEDGIIADLEEVAYFKVTEGSELWSFLPSETLNFVATETYITGTVPYTGKVENGTVAIELYLEGNLVKELRSDLLDTIIVQQYDYFAYVDITGYIGDTAGVVFDSMLAVYYENGAEIASSIVDPFTAVNNIVSPTVEAYRAVLLPPSVLIASHVDIDQIGDVVTVTADANFMIADDEGVYTDGQYTYTFAGWYVDNQKVSTSPVYTFELTDNVVISPQYTVTYEKTSDANDKQTPQPQPVQPDNSIDTNVLIIGICAVIVALIAVVYAVIKKE